MKKIFLSFIFLGGILFFSACQERETKLPASPYDTVNELPGLSSFIAESSTGAGGMTVIYDNQSTREFTYGEAFVIEQQVGDQWYQLPYLDEEGVAFIEIAYSLPPKTQREWRVSWGNIYDNLDPGSYRLIKEFVGVEDDRDYYRLYPIATVFTIE